VVSEVEENNGCSNNNSVFGDNLKTLRLISNDGQLVGLSPKIEKEEISRSQQNQQIGCLENPFNIPEINSSLHSSCCYDLLETKKKNDNTPPDIRETKERIEEASEVSSNVIPTTVNDRISMVASSQVMESSKSQVLSHSKSIRSQDVDVASYSVINLTSEKQTKEVDEKKEEKNKEKILLRINNNTSTALLQNTKEINENVYNIHSNPTLFDINNQKNDKNASQTTISSVIKFKSDVSSFPVFQGSCKKTDFNLFNNMPESEDNVCVKPDSSLDESFLKENPYWMSGDQVEIVLFFF
jgi:Icc-related predicted phosphoesterase